MNGWSGAAVIAVAGVIVLRGWMTGCDVYGSFLQGAEKGMRGALSLLPALCAMLLMLAVMNASGLTELLTRLVSPLTGVMHLPAEAAPMLMLRPLTGSGSLAAMERIFETCGPDSRAGRIASVLMGSSETIFYTVCAYMSPVKNRKTGYAVGCSLLGALAGTWLAGMLF